MRSRFSVSYLCATTVLMHTLPLQEKMLKQMKSHGQSKKHAVRSACLSVVADSHTAVLM